MLACRRQMGGLEISGGTLPLLAENRLAQNDPESP